MLDKTHFICNTVAFNGLPLCVQFVVFSVATSNETNIVRHSSKTTELRMSCLFICYIFVTLWYVQMTEQLQTLKKIKLGSTFF